MRYRPSSRPRRTQPAPSSVLNIRKIVGRGKSDAWNISFRLPALFFVKFALCLDLVPMLGWSSVAIYWLLPFDFGAFLVFNVRTLKQFGLHKKFQCNFL